jgi:dUTP pyrophosphatase
LAFKNHIDVFAGVIDRDYKDEIMVLLYNHSNKPFTIRAKDRIAQLLFCYIAHPTFTMVDRLTLEGNREGGFGSTGV